MAKKIYDAVAIVGTYQDKQGNEKKRYLNVGSVFESDKGLYMKLDALPVGDFNGWISFYEPKQRDSQASSEQQQTAPKADFSDMESDIPF